MKRSRRMLGILAAMVVLALAFLVLIFVFQRRLIYFPGPSPADTGTRLPLGATELAVPTADGLSLAAWLVPSRTGTAATTVIVFPGNAGDRSMRVPLAAALSAAGHDVLLLDYRGYGGNPGRPSERGLFEDARAARRYALEVLGEDPRRLVYFGESLGTGIAAALSAEHPPAALVLRSPFPSLAAVGRAHYPFLPVSLLLRDRFESTTPIRSLRCPLLVIAGARDRIVPPESSRRLFDAAPGPKLWLEIPGADHNDWELLAGRQLIDAASTFLAIHVPADR